MLERGAYLPKHMGIAIVKCYDDAVKLCSTIAIPGPSEGACAPGRCRDSTAVPLHGTLSSLEIYQQLADILPMLKAMRHCIPASGKLDNLATRAANRLASHMKTYVPSYSSSRGGGDKTLASVGFCGEDACEGFTKKWSLAMYRSSR